MIELATKYKGPTMPDVHISVFNDKLIKLYRKLTLHIAKIYFMAAYKYQ